MIEVVDYDPAWPATFATLRDRIAPALADAATAIEHVGSTSVPGLAAKPVIDLDVIVPDAASVPIAIARLATLGYAHRGDLGVAGREAFRAPADLPRHHLYVVPAGHVALRNHLAVRDALRADADLVARYAAMKRELAARFPDDVDGYCAGKSAFLLAILAAAGFDDADREAVAAANRPR